MSIMQLTVSNGKFTKVDGVPIEVFSDIHVVGNGWRCKVKPNGMIWCQTDAELSSGKCVMIYTVREDGFARLTIQEPNKKSRTIRKGFVIPKGASIDGIITLSDGIVCKRNAYFHNCRR